MTLSLSALIPPSPLTNTSNRPSQTDAPVQVSIPFDNDQPTTLVYLGIPLSELCSTPDPATVS